MAVPYVDLSVQYRKLKQEILKKIEEIFNSGNYILTDEVKKFEENFAEYCQTKYAIGVGSGTDALFLSLKALDIKKGDEVITAPNSFIATAGAIVAANAKPVFVDVRDDYNINPELIERAITDKTKVIMPVHMTGRSADLEPIIEISKKHNLQVIEDAAQAIGAKYKEARVGSFGITGCFSLHPLKNLHIYGDGGVITTNNSEIYEKLIKLRNHGLINRDSCSLWGYNSRLDALQAGIANIKLKYIDQWNEKRRKIASFYRDNLSNLVKVPIDKVHEEPVYQVFVIRCGNRDELQKFLLQQGIDTKVHYPIPIHLQNSAKDFGYKKGDFPNTEEQAKTILSLPIYPHITKEQINAVVENIKAFTKKTINRY